MNIIQSISTVFLFILFLIGIQQKQKTEPTDPLGQKIKATHLQSYLHFQQTVDSLVAKSADATQEDISTLQEQIIATRLAYKRVEFLVDHFHTKYTYLKLNGGPLYKMNEDEPEFPLIEPNGLQTLDELLFSQEVADHLDSSFCTWPKWV